MNLTCMRHGHDFEEIYPLRSDRWIKINTRFLQCTRCGKVVREGPPHDKLESKLTGKVHELHKQMAIESAEKYGV